MPIPALFVAASALGLGYIALSEKKGSGAVASGAPGANGGHLGTSGIQAPTGTVVPGNTLRDPNYQIDPNLIEMDPPAPGEAVAVQTATGEHATYVSTGTGMQQVETTGADPSVPQASPFPQLGIMGAPPEPAPNPAPFALRNMYHAITGTAAGTYTRQQEQTLLNENGAQMGLVW